MFKIYISVKFWFVRGPHVWDSCFRASITRPINKISFNRSFFKWLQSFKKYGIPSSMFDKFNKMAENTLEFGKFLKRKLFEIIMIGFICIMSMISFCFTVGLVSSRHLYNSARQRVRQLSDEFHFALSTSSKLLSSHQRWVRKRNSVARMASRYHLH